MSKEQKSPLQIEETEIEGKFEVTRAEKKQKIELSNDQLLKMSRMTAQEREEFLHTIGKL